MRKVRYVPMAVHPSFFDKMEEQRKTTQDQLGVNNLSWTKFTEILGRKGEIKVKLKGGADLINGKKFI